MLVQTGLKQEHEDVTVYSLDLLNAGCTCLFSV